MHVKLQLNTIMSAPSQNQVAQAVHDENAYQANTVTSAQYLQGQQAYITFAGPDNTTYYVHNNGSPFFYVPQKDDEEEEKRAANKSKCCC